MPHLEPLLTRLSGGITSIDTGMADERDLNAVYLLAGDEPCLVEAAPEADVGAVRSALDRLGVGGPDLAHIVVTHIHMDHAGGVGALLETFPRATVWVHERGAPHLADPTRLVASTTRTYGEERRRRLFGGMRAAPPSRIRAVSDGDRISMGDRSMRVLHTPGHASHHIALADDPSGVVFTGEAIGSYLPWGPAYRPALPPPEVDVRQALTSIAAIRSVGPAALLTSHFGTTPRVDDALERAEASILRWSDRVHRLLADAPDLSDDALSRDLETLAAREFEEQTGRSLGVDIARYDVLGSIRMNAQGLGRYWRRLSEAASAP